MLGIPKLTIFIFNNLLKFNKTTTYKKNSEYIKKNYLYMIKHIKINIIQNFLIIYSKNRIKN